jgi:transposase
MAGKKWYSTVEIASKLTRANDLAAQGKLQSEIASTLGVSVMTLYRWRKAPPAPQPARGGSARLDAQRGRPNCRTPAREFTVAAAGDRSTS